MIRRIILTGLVNLVLVVTFPLAAYADTAPADPTDPNASETPSTTTDIPANNNPTPPTDNSEPVTPTDNIVTQPANPQGPAQTPGPSSPTGADSTSYSYNPSTGLWENAYYTWDPVTHLTQPKTQQSYSYNPGTGMWDTTQYVFDPAQGQYVPNVVSVAMPPSGAALLNPAASTSDSGPGSTNNVNNDTQNNGYFNLFFNGSISNTVNNMAASGNASVIGNTIAGSALTGEATDISNILNMLQSTWNIQPASNLLTFSTDINGDVNGDLTLNLPSINDTGPLSTNNSSTQNQNNLTVNNQGSGLINNDITVGSKSGDAAVSDNTQAGGATTGAANSVANVVNVLNTAIDAGKSFLGVVNINGNLNGDILLPPNFLDQLISSSAPRATVNTSAIQNNNVVANFNNNQAIDNQLNIGAASGSATVANNTTAGNATSGNAGTNVTIFNLTGNQVVAKNSLMLFVNVLGQWVGLIMDAPPGSTAAALCGGTCNSSVLADNNVNVNSDVNNVINNKLNVNAQSGNALVSDNTRAGNATSGNATASANLLNMMNSSFDDSGWFGILFINVFGTWHGSFGINTDAGNMLAAGNNTTGPTATFATATSSIPPKVFSFIPHGSAGLPAQVNDQEVSDSGGNSQTKVLAASTTKSTLPPAAHSAHLSASSAINWLLPIVGASIVLLIMGAGTAGELNDRLSAAIVSHKVSKRGANQTKV
jgi:hypothetical protein